MSSISSRPNYSYKLRHEQYSHIHQLINTDSNFSPFVHIHGPQGSGKTSVVLDYLSTHHIRHTYIDLQKTLQLTILDTILTDLMQSFGLQRKNSSNITKANRSRSRILHMRSLHPRKNVEFHTNAVEIVNQLQIRHQHQRGPEYVVVLDNADSLVVNHHQMLMNLGNDQSANRYVNSFDPMMLSLSSTAATTTTTTTNTNSSDQLGMIHLCYHTLLESNISIAFLFITTTPIHFPTTPLSIPFKRLIFPRYNAVEVYHILTKLYILPEHCAQVSSCYQRHDFSTTESQKGTCSSQPTQEAHDLQKRYSGLVNPRLCIPIPLNILAIRLMSEMSAFEQRAQLQQPSSKTILMQKRLNNVLSAIDWTVMPSQSRLLSTGVVNRDPNASHHDGKDDKDGHHHLYNYKSDGSYSHELFFPQILRGNQYCLTISPSPSSSPSQGVVSQNHQQQQFDIAVHTSGPILGLTEAVLSSPTTSSFGIVESKSSSDRQCNTRVQTQPVVYIPLLSLLSLSFVDLIIRNECIPSASLSRTSEKKQQTPTTSTTTTHENIISNATTLTDLHHLYLQCYSQLCYAGFETLVMSLSHYILHLTTSDGELSDRITQLEHHIHDVAPLNMHRTQISQDLELAASSSTSITGQAVGNDSNNDNTNDMDADRPKKRQRKQSKTTPPSTPSKSSINAKTAPRAASKYSQYDEKIQSNASKKDLELSSATTTLQSTLESLGGWFGTSTSQPESTSSSSSIVISGVDNSLQTNTTSNNDLSSPLSSSLHNTSPSLLDLLDIVLNLTDLPPLPSQQKSTHIQHALLPGVIKHYTFPRSLTEINALILPPAIIHAARLQLVIPTLKTDHHSTTTGKPSRLTASSTTATTATTTPKQSNVTEPFQWLYLLDSIYALFSVHPTTTVMMNLTPTETAPDQTTSGHVSPTEPQFDIMAMITTDDANDEMAFLSQNDHSTSTSTTVNENTNDTHTCISTSPHPPSQAVVVFTQSMFDRIQRTINLGTFTSTSSLGHAILIASYLSARVPPSYDSALFQHHVTQRIRPQPPSAGYNQRERNLMRTFTIDRLLIIAIHVVANARRFSHESNNQTRQSYTGHPFESFFISNNTVSHTSMDSGISDHDTFSTADTAEPVQSDRMHAIQMETFYHVFKQLIAHGYIRYATTRRGVGTGTYETTLNENRAQALSQDLNYPFDTMVPYFT